MAQTYLSAKITFTSKDKDAHNYTIPALCIRNYSLCINNKEFFNCCSQQVIQCNTSHRINSANSSLSLQLTDQHETVVTCNLPMPMTIDKLLFINNNNITVCINCALAIHGKMVRRLVNLFKKSIGAGITKQMCHDYDIKDLNIVTMAIRIMNIPLNLFSRTLIHKMHIFYFREMSTKQEIAKSFNVLIDEEFVLTSIKLQCTSYAIEELLLFLNNKQYDTDAKQS